MTNLDKFCSDVQKAAARAIRDGTTPSLATELERLFMEWTRSYGPLAQNLLTFWTDRYAGALGNEKTRDTAIERLVSLMALITGVFDDDMDFADTEWEDIREIVTAEAEDMEMDRLMEIMSIIVSRGVL